MAVTTFTSIPPGNMWGGLKQFFLRGGTVNGLNPGIVGRIWYVHGEGVDGENEGADSNTGRSPDNAFATMGRALEMVDTFDIIVPRGVFREQRVAPEGVENVTIAAPVIRPRQATSSGTPTGGGCSWLPPASPTAGQALLEIIRPGWSVFNMQMNPAANAAAIRLTTSPTVDLDAAGHFTAGNCFFTGGVGSVVGQNGIEDNGGSGFVQINGCRFLQLANAIIGLNTAAAVPLSWDISEQNMFQQNTNDILMSLSYATIMRNIFKTAGSGATNKVISTVAIAAQGDNNQVLLNQFSNTAAQIQNSNGYNGGAADTWVNYVNDNSGALVAGVPGA